MKTLIGMGAAALSALVLGPALAEAPKPALSTAQVQAALNPVALDDGDNGIMAPDVLAAMLAPAAPAARATSRSLSWRDGPAQPTAGHGGVIPDLKIRFDTSSARITPQAGRQLAALALAMQFPQLRELHFVIAGHTDARGSATANRLLSQKRAEAVVVYLVRSQTIAADRLEAKGYGEAELADPADPASGVNRRVEVRVD